MAVADLRQTTPEPQALALIPDSMAREHFVIPIKLDEVGLYVAMADQPSPELLTLLGQTSGNSIRPMLAPLSEIRRAIDNNYKAIGGLDHLVQAFEAVETTRRRPSTHDHRRPDRGRRCAGCPGGRPDPHAGHARPGIRRPHRADRGRAAGSLPDRRRAQGSPDAARIHGRRPHQPDQDHGRHEHRRAAPTAGRPAADGDRRQGSRRPRGDGRHHLGREVRDAAARPDALGPPSGRAGDAGRLGRDLLQLRPGPLRHGAVRRARPAAARRRRSTRR